MNNYDIDNIPKEYLGIGVRSTLEASWAIMFDKLSWEWAYEPFRFNHWVPDFVIQGKGSKILVEVKPYNKLTDFDEYETYNQSTFGTIYQTAEILLLGNTPIKKADLHPYPAIGWLIERPNDQRHHAVIWDTPLGYGFANDNSSWPCRITGAYEGGSGILGTDWKKINDMWFDACSQARELPNAVLPDWPIQFAHRIK